ERVDGCLGNMRTGSIHGNEGELFGTALKERAEVVNITALEDGF
ncbi:hypothetical protein A2U01_0086314, partial [Trifolium medium]|nr:hypothetical protein [Trifolium medium]